MALVFVNYRNLDSAHAAAAMYERLAAVFGPEQVFRDARTMGPGERYPPAMRSALQRADAVVAIIGPQWLEVDEHGVRLIDRESDWVRWEIATAVELGIPIVPVLLDETPLPDAAKLPGRVGELTRYQVSRLRHGDQGRDLDRLATALVELVPALGLGRVLVQTPALPDDPLPSALLRAEHAVVPFAGRDHDLARLREWAEAAGRCSAYLLTGPAGQGKTRLAEHLATTLRREGWTAGALAEQAETANLMDLTRLERPLLLIMDYAEGRAAQLMAVAEAIGRSRSGAPVRLLLVGRSAGDWLTEARRTTDETISAMFATMPHHRLPSLVPAAGDRPEEFARSLQAFGAYLDVDTTDVVAPADLARPRFDRILDVHAAALAGLLDQTDRHWGTEASADPVDRVLHHEARYWRRAADAFGLDAVAYRQLPAVVTLATVFGAADRRAASGLLGRLTPDPGRLSQLIAWAEELYPGPLVLNPLRPDRLGEDLAAATLLADPSLLADSAATADEHQVIQALTVMGRAMPRHRGLATIVRPLIDADAEHRVPAAMTVATQLEDPGPLVAAIAASVDSAPDDLVRQAAEYLPEASEALGDFGVNTLRRALQVHRAIGTSDAAVLAQLNLRLASQLRARNRPDEALGPADEAVHGYRALAADDPDAYAPFEAQALNNKALTLRALGRYQQALDTIELALNRYAMLAAGDRLPFRKSLADAMDTRAVCLQELGHTDDALAAATATLQVREQLAQAHPELYRAGHAAALNNAALRNREAGRRSAAVEYARQAAAIYQDLADGRPDAFRQDHAVALSTLALTESDLGNHGPALDAIEACAANMEQLAAQNRQAHLPNLATVTAMRAIRLGNAGRPDDALAAAGEAVTLYRELADTRPAVFQPHLAMALNSLANRQAKLDKLDDALASSAEAVRLCEQPAEDARTDLSDLATALNTHGTVQLRLGDLAASISTLTTCVQVRRQLAARNAQAFLPDLAGSLLPLARAHAAAGSSAKARELLREGAQILEPFAAELPRRYGPGLLELLIERADLPGDPADAVTALTRAADLADGSTLDYVQGQLNRLRGTQTTAPPAI